MATATATATVLSVTWAMKAKQAMQAQWASSAAWLAARTASLAALAAPLLSVCAVPAWAALRVTALLVPAWALRLLAAVPAVLGPVRSSCFSSVSVPLAAGCLPLRPPRCRGAVLGWRASTGFCGAQQGV